MKFFKPISTDDHLTHPKYRPDIDGLRAIAVLAVVCFHAFPFWLKGGFIGVDIFFIISGFLISTIIFDNLERGSFSFIAFYSHRINRIFPALLLVLSTCFAFGWFALLADEYKQLGKHVAAGAGFISNFVFWNESGYFDNAAETKPLLHLWTLGIEEQFYIAWPLLLWTAWKGKFNLLTLTLIITIISFALNIKGLHSDAIATFYSPQTRFWELLIGSILAYVTLYKPNGWATKTQKLYTYLNAIIYTKSSQANANTLRNVQSFLGAAIISAGLLIITKESHFPGTWALIPTLGAVLIISAGSQAWLNRVLLSNRVLVWFGLISFPLYLWHWPLLSFARIVESETPSRNIRIAAVVISIVLAWLTYQFIEKPVRFRKFGNVKTLVLAALMIVVGSAGYYTYKHDGLRFRFDKEIKEIRALQQITDVNSHFNFYSGMRKGVCHSVPLSVAFSNNCFEKREKNIYIWGDSYAASLYMGLNYIRNRNYKDYGIGQLTDGNGPPFFIDGLTADKITLIEANTNRLEVIKLYQPNIIIITWRIGGSGAAVNIKEDALSALALTIDKIKNASTNSKIIVIGPVPNWNESLTKQILKYYSIEKKLPPEYMALGLSEKPKIWDEYFKINIPKLNVTYISALDYLCNEKGCLTRASDNIDDLTAVDGGHLTTNGSIYLIDKIKHKIFTD